MNELKNLKLGERYSIKFDNGLIRAGTKVGWEI
jgi:hypothetical protein